VFAHIHARRAINRPLAKFFDLDMDRRLDFDLVGAA